jgi:MSHA biogenesis protein MshQ
MRNSYFIYLFTILVLQISTGVFAGTVQVTTTGAVNEINAGAISITGGATGAPEATATNTNTGVATITTPITTLTNNAWLIDVVGSGNGGSYTPGAGQTERWDTSAASGTGASSTKLVATAGLDSMAQTHSTTSNRTAHAIMAVAPATTIALDTTSSANILTSNTLSWTHTVLGSDAKLVVAIAVENGTCSGNEVVTGVTYDGAPLTFVTAITVDTGFCQRVELWYLDIAFVGNIQVTMTGTVNEINAGAISITGGATGAPEATATNTNTGVATITTPITTLTNNAWLIDVVGSGNGGSYTPGAGQTERWDTSAASGTGASSTKLVATAGLDSMAQTHSTTSNRTAHAIMAVAPATTIALDTTSSANILTSNTLSWTHTVLGSDAKLVVAIAVENGTCSGNEVVTGVTYDGAPLTFVTAITVDTGFCQRVELWYLDFVTEGNLQTYYRMDETWTVPAADEVLDYSGNGNHGDTIASGTGTQISNNGTAPAIASDPGTCGYGVFPLNTSQLSNHSVDSKLTPDDTGSVTFWYRNDADWVSSGNRKLLDASIDANNRFFLTKMSNGRLRFRLEVGGSATQAQTAVQTFLANTWVHIGVTWDLSNDTTEIYINGTLSATSSTSVGTGSAWDSLYIGDNRANLGGQGNTGRSAGGLIDEVRIYDGVVLQTTVDADRLSTHPCTLVDHYEITIVSGDPGICNPAVIDITAHNIIDAAINVPSGTVLDFSTLTGNGIWGPTPGPNPLVGTGTWSPTGLDDGDASYTWPGGESLVQINLSHGSAVTENVDLDDGSATELSGDPSEDPDIVFSGSPIIRITNDGSSEGSISTEISGKDSDQAPSQTLYIQLKQSGITFGGADACEVPGLYAGVNAVSIAAECIDPNTCAGEQVTIENNSGTPVAINTYDSGSVPGSGSWTTVNLDFDSGGSPGLFIDDDNKAILVFNYPDAGQMTLHFDVTINPPGPAPNRNFTGSSNTFVVRPFGLYIDDFKVDGSPKTNPAATDGTGGVFTKAGQDFTADITAVPWGSGDDGDFDGVPDSNSTLSDNASTPTLNFGNESTAVIADISHTLIAPDPAVITGAESGTLTGGGNVSGFVSGVIDDHTMSWDEVGIIQLDVNESNNDYLGGGQDVTGQIPYLGRFTPANLTVAVNGGTNFEDACTAGSFTYMGQEFYFDPAPNDAPRIRVRGVNTSGARTYNYDTTEFFKLDTTTLPRTYTDQSGAAASFGYLVDVGDDVEYQNLQEDNNPNGNIFLRLQDGSDGDHFMYSRVSEEAPFTGSVDLTFEAAGLIDTDQVCYDGDGDSICDGITPTPLSTDDDFAFGNIMGTSQRFGRLNIGTAVGSELLTLSPSFITDYFDGTGFTPNTDDDCTLIDDVAPNNGIPDLVLDNNFEVTVTDGDIQICTAGGTTTFTLANSTLVDGDGQLSFSAPGADCIGYSGITLDLTTLGIGHLLYDWDGVDQGLDLDAYDDDPTGRIDFGLFKGPDEFIYIREPW